MFLIVDGNSIGCRAAYVPPVLTNSKGRETGGTYRFIAMLDRAMRMVRATHVVVAFDVARENFRMMIDESYKANRGVGSSSLYDQFQDIKTLLDAIGIKHVGVRGYEADDVIGTYATLSRADENYILTGDRDGFQLINDNTVVIFPKTGVTDIKMVTKAEFVREYGIDVERFVELKAMMGDESDNIKGIRKCGPKTALRLLREYGSIDGVIRNVTQLKGKLRENVEEWIPNAGKTLRLVTIRRDVPVPYGYDECRINLRWENARYLFEELEFNSYLNRLTTGDFYGAEGS